MRLCMGRIDMILLWCIRGLAYAPCQSWRALCNFGLMGSIGMILLLWRIRGLMSLWAVSIDLILLWCIRGLAYAVSFMTCPYVNLALLLYIFEDWISTLYPPMGKLRTVLCTLRNLYLIYLVAVLVLDVTILDLCRYCRVLINSSLWLRHCLDYYLS